jgi:hypothetical protein
MQNFRDLFVQTTGTLLFEESYVKLNLLLRDSFGWEPKIFKGFSKNLPFKNWYMWRPEVAIRTNKSQQWIVTLVKKSIHPLVQNWLNSEHFIFSQGVESILIEFVNDVDRPRIISKHKLPEESNILAFFRVHKYKQKKYIDFCNKKSKTTPTNMPINLRKDIDFALKEHGAVYFFPEGFYLAPSSVPNAGYGLFSLGYIPPARILFNFEGKRLTPKSFQSLETHRRTKIEAFACEASFLILETQPDDSKQSSNSINLVFDPTNSKYALTVKDMHENPNAGPWINEPPIGFVSNVFLQGFTCFNLPEENLNRYMLFVVSARNIYPHDELFLHYHTNYSRQGLYSPGECCPDVLPSNICE